MNDKIDYPQWEFQLKSEADELRRLAAMIEKGSANDAQIAAQITVLDMKWSPMGREINVYVNDYEVHSAAL